MFRKKPFTNIKKYETQVNSKPVAFYVDYENVTLFAKYDGELYYGVIDCSSNALQTVLKLITAEKLKEFFKRCPDDAVIEAFITNIQPLLI